MMVADWGITLMHHAPELRGEQRIAPAIAYGASAPQAAAPRERLLWVDCGPSLYRLPVIPRCGRVDRQAYYVWGMEDAGILFPQRTGGGRAAALGTTREWACLPAGSDDREHARGNGA